MNNIVTCLWFDQQGMDAARFYTSIFPEFGDWHPRGCRRKRATLERAHDC